MPLTYSTRRVVHLTSVHPATDIRIHRKECLSLAAAGYNVVLIAPGQSGSVKFSTPIEVLEIPQSRSRFTRMCISSARVFVMAARTRADLYHAHDPELLPCLRALRWLGRRIVYDMHENTPKALLTKPWIPVIFRASLARIYRNIEKLLLSKVPVVFAEDSYVTDYPWVTDSVIVRNYPLLDELFGISELPHDTPTIAYVGSVARERGSFTVLDAVRLCWQRGMAIDVEYIGPISSDHRQELLKSVPTKARGQLRITGYVEPDCGWRLLARAHIGVALLDAAPNYVESLPTKILEYMALGKPVIASNFPLYRKIVEQNGAGICVDPRDVSAVAAAIERLVTCPEYARSCGERGRAIVQEQYSWQPEGKKLIKLYERLHGRPSSWAQDL